MLRVHVGNFVPKYRKGFWFWKDEDDELEFDSYDKFRLKSEEYHETNGFKFLRQMNQLEEVIFRQEFRRSEDSFDADVILMQDVIDLVMFLTPMEIITKKFIHFVNTATVHSFLKALSTYFEHFLRLVEFLLIRRDEISGKMPRMQSQESVKIKQIFSSRLMQHRLILAREYSKMLLGEFDMAPFHHYNAELHISKTIRDRSFHESFLAFCTQVIWISMHRRAYDVINMEMGRLFRSEHFALPASDSLNFSEAERRVLYGKNYRRVNYRVQNSPIIQEISNVARENLPILWIGEQKYRGTDLRIHELEMEYLVPTSQLVLIGMVRGILGHPKKLYDTLLRLNWSEVRKQNYSEDYDPYDLIKQPRMKLPNINEETLRKHAEQYEAFFKIEKLQERWDKDTIRKWSKREKILNHFRTSGVLEDACVKAQQIIGTDIERSTVDEITTKFLARQAKLQKIVKNK